MRATGRRARGRGRDSSPWADMDNWLAERHTDPGYVRQRAACCGCHPDAHDLLVGCLVCGCEATVDASLHGMVYEEEVQVLVRGATMDMAERVARMLGLVWRAAGTNGHRYMEAGQYRRLARQLRLQVELQQRAQGMGVR